MNKVAVKHSYTGYVNMSFYFFWVSTQEQDCQIDLESLRWLWVKGLENINFTVEKAINLNINFTKVKKPGKMTLSR